ncbi:hypothetical protein IWW38_004644 [Coemansia aciculifera]|uniref:Uncharacterized protein n=1 Tax=Coemansia aciculifera TaxID=417176 RepID=A0ACC1LY87_9FUNG|nr:hypothetical protein IWW38_004644 [Coemansia aciculifera]
MFASMCGKTTAPAYMKDIEASADGMPDPIINVCVGPLSKSGLWYESVYLCCSEVMPSTNTVNMAVKTPNTDEIVISRRVLSSVKGIHMAMAMIVMLTFSSRCALANPNKRVICVPLIMIHDTTVPQQYKYVITVANQYPAGPNASRETSEKLDMRRPGREYMERLKRTPTYQPTMAIKTKRIMPNHPHRRTTEGRFIVPVPMLIHMTLNTPPIHDPLRGTACSRYTSLVVVALPMSGWLDESAKSFESLGLVAALPSKVEPAIGYNNRLLNN